MRYSIIIAAALPLCLLGCAEKGRQTKLRPGTTFAIHVVAAQQGPNTKPLTDPSSDAILNLVDPPVISAANVTSATVTTDENEAVVLDVNLDGPGAANLQAATATAGQRVALVVNGEIVATPVVHAPLGAKFRVEGSYSRFDWRDILQ